jgi:hypothetical protein
MLENNILAKGYELTSFIRKIFAEVLCLVLYPTILLAQEASWFAGTFEQAKFAAQNEHKSIITVFSSGDG